MSAQWLYIVTDIEADGPWPAVHSMRSFASVAVRASGEVVGEFEAVLEPLPGTQPDPQTYAWFQGFPDAWAAATTDAEPPDQVMHRFTRWLRDLPRPHRFAAKPVGFDALWIDYYLRRYTRYGVVQQRHEDKLFDGVPLCLSSLAAGALGVEPHDVDRAIDPAWLGGHEHTHRAIDDARGYANLLAALFERAN